MNIDKYKKKLEDQNVSYVDLGNWLAKYRPKFLYKYIRFDDEGYWRDNTIGGQAFFQRVDYLNDPFDCLAYFNKEKLIDKLFENVNESFSKEMLRQGFLERMQQTGKNLDDLFNEFRKSTRVFCMSEVNDSVLMWTHYSANHSGICIEYDVEKMHQEFQRAILPVIYSKHRYDSTETIIRIVCKQEYNKNTIINPLFYKASQWSYEKEWRYIADESSFSNEKYIVDLGSYISAVYFGVACKLEGEREKEILYWTERNKIARYKMNIEHSNYKLIPVRF